ncbi:MAG: flavin reductase family protein [Collinsella sp.]|nr:flavin reductase family protein [Collinsella sp.]
MGFQEIGISELTMNPFEKIGSDWALLSAGDAESFNTMTVSWGGLGVIWNKNVATVYVRPQRYTKRFIDGAERFTLSFYDAKHKRALGVLGTKSGLDTDKVGEVGFTPFETDGTIAFEEAELILVCRKLYVDTIKPECFIDRSCDESCYPERDHHAVYIGEVEKVLRHA